MHQSTRPEILITIMYRYAMICRYLNELWLKNMEELFMFIDNEVVKLNKKTSSILIKILIDVSYVLRWTIRIRININFLSRTYAKFLMF